MWSSGAKFWSGYGGRCSYDRYNRIGILKQIGSLIEEPAYYDNLTGFENMQILKELKGLTDHDVAEALAIVRLTDYKDKRVKHYS